MGTDIDENIKWFIDIFADMFNIVDIKKIKKQFDEEGKDPYIYFYETFLNEYDKASKKEKGVYYTPTPIVKFIVNSVDEILKRDFNLSNGIADDTKIVIKKEKSDKTIAVTTDNKVQILDPATGTGTFLAEIIDKIYSYFTNNKGMWNDYCEKELVSRIHGFEYMMASYTMAHLKMDMKLKETGFDISNCIDKRLGIYLTNTLEIRDENIKELGLARWLSDEALAARKVKNNVPVMVIIGNPPYSGESKNKYEDEIYMGYKEVDERNKKPLNDDYVKFIAYGHSLIKKNDEGILAYINNNGFLDNITFTSMRKSLLDTFDTIYILNLYGDLEKNKNNRTMKGDENVFAITKGVCINIFIKNNKKKINSLATVYYAEIIGSQEKKYQYLLKNNINNIKWKKIKYKSPEYFFIEMDYSFKDEYDAGFSIKDLFITNNDGIVTARDDFTINEYKDELINIINDFLSLDNETARTKYNLGADTSDWKLQLAKDDLLPNPIKNKKLNLDNIVKIQYRPFDIRYTFYTGTSKGFHSRPRAKIMQHFIMGENIGLAVCRQSVIDSWEHIAVTKYITSKVFISTRTREGCCIIPLYLYTEKGNNERQPNLNLDIVKNIENIIKLNFENEKTENIKTFAPIDILDYIYAVLHSLKYRTKYLDYLKIDFPNIKYPSDITEFKKLVKLGKELRELHLMENIESRKISIKFPINGNDEIENVKYENGKVYINPTQYFETITLEVWDYFIGGYQPARKWLKDRKGKILNYEQKKHYMSIIYIIEETIKLQAKIDEVIIL